VSKRTKDKQITHFPPEGSLWSLEFVVKSSTTLPGIDRDKFGLLGRNKTSFRAEKNLLKQQKTLA
jgi:hypothetical protein